MTMSINIHRYYAGDAELRFQTDEGPRWDNDNSISLRFQSGSAKENAAGEPMEFERDRTEITLFGLSETDAKLLSLAGRLSPGSRAKAASFLQKLLDVDIAEKEASNGCA